MDAWKSKTTARERVQMVVETLDEPASVNLIKDKANVAWDTAKKELERLEEEGRVQPVDEEGERRYVQNPVWLLFDEIVSLIDEHSRDELEQLLIQYQSELDDLQEEHDAERATEFRSQIGAEELDAEEMRDVRNIASTWEALETERRLISHALTLYEDVSEFEHRKDTGIVALS